MAHDYDLIVIGGGSGGVRAARLAAGHGAKVCVIEEYRLGGTCVIRGCVPKKLLVYASRFSGMLDLAPSFGWQMDGTFDWPTLLANKDKEIDRLEKVYGNLLKGSGVETRADRAVVSGPNSVKLTKSGEELTADKILIATGGHPFVPEDIPGHELGITSNEAFELQTLPKNILVVGGGYIAVEFAGIFNGLGVETTLAYRGAQILRGFDAHMRESLSEEFDRRGIHVKLGTQPSMLSECEAGIRVNFADDSDEEYGAVMFATGRVPNTKGLGLENAGITLGKHGEVPVDDYSRTSCKSVFAVGDVTNRAALTPVAIREGQAFADTEFGGKDVKVDHSIIPTAVFTSPEIGTVGLTEEQAIEQHAQVDVWIARFKPMIYSFKQTESRTTFKVITEHQSGKVLGVHIMGSEAGEMIQLVGIAVTMGATKADFDRTIAVHPVAAEELVTMKAPAYRIVNGERLSE